MISSSAPFDRDDNKGNTTCTRAVEHLLVVVRRSELGKIRQRLRTIYQVITESNGGPWIILRNEANNLFEFFERLRERKLFSSPSTNFLADASEGNTLSGIKLGSSLVETRQQRLLFRG